MLLNFSAIPQIRERWPLVFPHLYAPVELREQDQGDIKLFGQVLELPAGFSDKLGLAHSLVTRGERKSLQLAFRTLAQETG